MGKYGKPHLHPLYTGSQSPVTAVGMVLIGLVTYTLNDHGCIKGGVQLYK